MNDPIVNEIRKFRDKHSKMFNYDIKAICENYKKKHKIYTEKLTKIKIKENAINTSSWLSCHCVISGIMADIFINGVTMAKDIIINFMPPGMLDFGVIENGEDIETTGYGPMPLT